MPPWAVVFALAAFDTVAPPPPADRWLAPDKIKHAAVAFTAQSGSYAVLRVATDHRTAMAGATLATVGVSLLKEHFDRGRTGFSVRDLAWDAAGAVLASLLLANAPQR